MSTPTDRFDRALAALAPAQRDNLLRVVKNPWSPAFRESINRHRTDEEARESLLLIGREVRATMSESYEKVAMPMTEEGECNFKALAELVLQFALDQRPGGRHYIQADLKNELSLFRMLFDGQGGVQVTRGSVTSRFGASLFMELERQGQGKVVVGVLDLEASRAYGDEP